MEFINILVENKVTILVALLALTEVLGLVPSIKANSIFELVLGVLQKLVPVAPKATTKA